MGTKIQQWQTCWWSTCNLIHHLLVPRRERPLCKRLAQASKPFCKRTSHAESIRRTKKAAIAQDQPSPSVSFFDGYSCGAKLQCESDSPLVFSTSYHIYDESIVGELEFFSKETSTTKEAQHRQSKKQQQHRQSKKQPQHRHNIITSSWQPTTL